MKHHDTIQIDKLCAEYRIVYTIDGDEIEADYVKVGELVAIDEVVEKDGIVVDVKNKILLVVA